MPGDKFLLTSAAYQKTADDQRAAVSLWDIATGKMVRNVAGPYPAGGVNESMADSFSLGANGRILAVVFHGGIPASAGLYDTGNWNLTETLKSFQTLRGQSGVAIASSIAVSPDGLYVGVGRTDGGIDIYGSDARTLLTRIDAYRESSSAVTQLVFSPDSKELLSVSSGNGKPQPNGSVEAVPDALRIWNVSNGGSVLSFPLKAGADAGKTRGIAWSSDGQHIASASDDHLVRLWDKNSPQSPAVVARFPREAWDVAFSPNGKRIAASGWSYVAITEIAN
jgi:Tol biopolymer transport system component